MDNAAENLSSLIRTSIDIDGWISDEKTQPEGHESGIVDDQNSNLFLQADGHNIAEGTLYSHFEPWTSECCEKEFCELRKCEESVSLVQPEYSPTIEIRNDVFDGVNCTPKPQQHNYNIAEQLLEADDQSSREEIRNCITLEKTPEQTRYEDVINLQRQTDPELTVQILNEMNLPVGNSAGSMSHGERLENSPFFEVAFQKNWNNPYLEAPQELKREEENQCLGTPARETMNCYKCHEIIQPRDWIRSIAAETGLTPVYHVNCFYCDYCKGVLCTDQYYTFHQGKLICNFDFQMLTNLYKVPDHNKKRLVVLHSVKKGRKKSVQMSLEQKEILQRALRSKDRPTNVKKNP